MDRLFIQEFMDRLDKLFPGHLSERGDTSIRNQPRIDEWKRWLDNNMDGDLLHRLLSERYTTKPVMHFSEFVASYRDAIAKKNKQPPKPVHQPLVQQIRQSGFHADGDDRDVIVAYYAACWNAIKNDKSMGAACMRKAIKRGMTDALTEIGAPILEIADLVRLNLVDPS